MKTLQTLLLWTAAAAAAISPALAQTPVRISADNVNLRAKPQLENSEVLAQVHYGDQLASYGATGDWIEVSAPESVSLWVSQDFIQRPANTVNTRRVNLRAGPSINYNVVATLDRGETVEIREELQGWLKIAPPPSARVWVHKDFIESPAAAETATAGEPPAPAAPAADLSPASEEPKPPRKRKNREVPSPSAAPASVSATEAGSTALPTPIVSPSVPVDDAIVREIPVPPPPGLNLIPLEGQGRLAEFEGELRAAPLINEAPTRYRVVRWQNNRWQILCHVFGEASKLRSLQNKRVRVKGREYWIQGAAAPVLVPDQVQEVAGE